MNPDGKGTTHLFDIDTKELSAYWVDPEQPLLIPKNPLHFKAHKLQLLIELLSKQASKSPAQFNSKNFIDAVNAYTSTIESIKRGDLADVSDNESGLGEDGNESPEGELGPSATSSVDSRVSPDNPFAGKGAN